MSHGNKYSISIMDSQFHYEVPYTVENNDSKEASKDIKQDCSYEMSQHATRADLAELATEISCRPATTKKWFGRGLKGVTK